MKNLDYDLMWFDAEGNRWAEVAVPLSYWNAANPWREFQEQMPISEIGRIYEDSNRLKMILQGPLKKCFIDCEDWP